jgi:hypothetical protein
VDYNIKRLEPCIPIMADKYKIHVKGGDFDVALWRCMEFLIVRILGCRNPMYTSRVAECMYAMMDWEKLKALELDVLILLGFNLLPEDFSFSDIKAAQESVEEVAENCVQTTMVVRV